MPCLSLYLVIVDSSCDDCCKYIFTSRSCIGGGDHCGFVVCFSVIFPWVNDTDHQFVDFNIAQSFVVDLDYSSDNALYLVEADSLTSCKADKCFNSIFIFTSGGIWKPLVIIRSANSLARYLKYAGHSWIVHVRVLSGRLIDKCKNYQTFFQGCLTWIYYFYLYFIDLFLKYHNTRLELSINFLLSRVRHSTSCTYSETYPTCNLSKWI